MTAKAQLCWQRHLGDLQRWRFWHYEICSKSPRWTGTEPWFGHRCEWRNIMVGLGSLHRTFIGRCGSRSDRTKPTFYHWRFTAATTTATATAATTTDTFYLMFCICFWDLAVKDSESGWWPDRSVLGNVCPTQCGQRERHSWRASHWTFKWLGHRTSK